jgi:ADP-ribosylglycohydrolase
MSELTTISVELVRNMLLGFAIGDAYGAGVEFQDRNWMRENVDFSLFVNARHLIQIPADQLAAFTQDYQAWDYTDDTEMTIGLIKALMSDELFTAENLLRHIDAEYRQGMQEKGHGRNGHGSLRWYFEGTKSIQEILDFQRDRPNPGNGAMVRAVPLGLLPAHVINDFAAINARATHPNPLAIIASQCVAWATEFMLKKQGDAADIFNYCAENIMLNEEYKTYLSAVDKLPAFQELTDAGFAILCGPQPIQAPYFLPGIHGLPSDSKFTAGSILYIIKHSKTAFEALKMAILLGGDVDSAASVATGIMAARHGIASIPQYMQENIEGKNYLQSVAKKLHQFLSKTQIKVPN